MYEVTVESRSWRNNLFEAAKTTCFEMIDEAALNFRSSFEAYLSAEASDRAEVIYSAFVDVSEIMLTINVHFDYLPGCLDEVVAALCLPRFSETIEATLFDFVDSGFHSALKSRGIKTRETLAAEVGVTEVEYAQAKAATPVKVARRF